jgi:hypothetical protein
VERYIRLLLELNMLRSILLIKLKPRLDQSRYAARVYIFFQLCLNFFGWKVRVSSGSGDLSARFLFLVFANIAAKAR